MSGLSGFILVVDDSDRFLPIIEKAYERLRIEVVGVKSFKAAKRVLLERTPEAILAPLRVKEDSKGGITFCSELKVHPELSKIAVMLIANEFNDGLIREASEHGAKGLIAWPASVQVIRKRLEPFIPDYLAKELTPEEIRARDTKLPTISKDELQVSVETVKSEPISEDIPGDNFDLAKLILAQVLHNLKKQDILTDTPAADVPRVVSEMTNKVCKITE